MRQVAVQTDAFSLRGGLHLNKSALEAKPGTLIDCLNYEPDVAGGYRRVKGYERFDGHSSPTDAGYDPVQCTLTSTPAAGVVLTIGAATCRFIKAVTGGMLVTDVTGTIPGSTAITGTGASGTTAADPILDYSPSNFEHATDLYDASQVMRPLISEVPGEGDVLGVWFYKDVLYAFRNHTGGATAKMFKSTAAGWVEVALGFVIRFNAGQAAAIAEGATVTGLVSGASCVARRVVVQSGAWSSNNAAGLIVTGAISGGAFSSGEALQVSATTRATTTAVSAAQTLLPGGSYQFVNHNFFGGADTRRVYGCDGVNNGFEFDGTYYVPIKTGHATDKPTAVTAHSERLVFGQDASITLSGSSLPALFDGALGAAEIATGDKVTNLISLPGKALAVFSRNSTRVLLGSSSADWNLQTISPETGAVEHTVQNIGSAIALDDRGVMDIVASQNYGNFDANTVSRQIQNIIDVYRNKVTTSIVLRNKNQYRLMTDDGSFITMKVEPGAGKEFCLGRFDIAATCACSEEGLDGQERAFFGAGNGMVYEMEKGSSFDGGDILAAFVVWPTLSRQPTTHKTYRHAWIEVKTDLYTEIELSPQIDYASGDTQPNLTGEYDYLYEARGAGGRWDSSYFESFFWDSPYVERMKMDINGNGHAIAFVVLSSSHIDPGHNVRSISFTYTPRRRMR